MPYEPDLLLVNANVLTMDPGRPAATAVAVAGGRSNRSGRLLREAFWLVILSLLVRLLGVEPQARPRPERPGCVRRR